MSIEEEFRFDVRIQERMVNKGVVGKEELDQRLSALRDLEDESEVLDLEQPGSISETSEEAEKSEGQ